MPVPLLGTAAVIRWSKAAAMNDYADEVLRAIEKEPDVHLADLDLAWYLEHGGNGALYERLMQEARRGR